MANIHCLMRFLKRVFLPLFFFCVVLLSSAAWSAIPATSSGSPGFKFGSAQSSCRFDVASACTSFWLPNAALLGSPQTIPQRCYLDNGAFNNYVEKSGCTVNNQCPANSTLGDANSTNGDLCTCNAGYNQSGGACVAAVPPADPERAAIDLIIDDLNRQGIVLTSESASGGRTACYEGFEVTAQGYSYAIKNGVPSGHKEFYGPFTSDGASCTPSPEAGAAAPSPCKAGESPGTVNGMTSCYPSGAIHEAPVKESKSGEGQLSDKSAPPSAESSEKETKCEGEKCTTTTTFKNGAGVTVGTNVSEKPKTSFCSENPTLEICKTSNYRSGNCVLKEPPSCKGDAIQCAIALDSFKTACALDPPVTAESQLYDASKGQQGSVLSTLPGSTTVAIGPTSFDTSNKLNTAAAGLADVTFTVIGQTVTLPFSKVNPALEMLGTILLASTFLLSARIVTRG